MYELNTFLIPFFSVLTDSLYPLLTPLFYIQIPFFLHYLPVFTNLPSSSLFFPHSSLNYPSFLHQHHLYLYALQLFSLSSSLPNTPQRLTPHHPHPQLLSSLLPPPFYPLIILIRLPFCSNSIHQPS